MARTDLATGVAPLKRITKDELTMEEEIEALLASDLATPAGRGFPFELVEAWGERGFMAAALSPAYGGISASLPFSCKMIRALGAKNQDAGWVVCQSMTAMYLLSRDPGLILNRKVQTCLENTRQGYRVVIAGSEQKVNSRKARARFSADNDGYRVNGTTLYGEPGYDDEEVARGKEYVTGAEPTLAEKTLVLCSARLGNSRATGIIWMNEPGVEVIETPKPYFPGSATNAIRLHNVAVEKTSLYVHGPLMQWDESGYHAGAIVMVGILANFVGHFDSTLKAMRKAHAAGIDFGIDGDTLLTEFEQDLQTIETRLYQSATSIDERFLQKLGNADESLATMLRLKIQMHEFGVRVMKAISHEAKEFCPCLLRAAAELAMIGKLTPLKHKEAKLFVDANQEARRSIV